MAFFKNSIFAILLFSGLCSLYTGPADAQTDQYKQLYQTCETNQKKFIAEIEKKDIEFALLKAETSEVIKKQLAEIERLKTAVTGLYEMLDAYSGSPLQKDQYMGRLQAELRKNSTELEALRTKLATAEDTLTAQAKRLDDKNRGCVPIEGDKDVLRKELNDLREASSRKDNELGKLRMEYQEKLVEIKVLSDLVNENKTASVEADKVEQELRQSNEELEAKETEIARLEADNEKLNSEVEKLTQITNQQQADIAKLSEELSREKPALKKVKKASRKETKPAKKAKCKVKKKDAK